MGSFRKAPHHILTQPPSLLILSRHSARSHSSTSTVHMHGYGGPPRVGVQRNRAILDGRSKLSNKDTQGVSDLLGRWREGLTRKRKSHVSPRNLSYRFSCKGAIEYELWTFDENWYHKSNAFCIVWAPMGHIALPKKLALCSGKESTGQTSEPLQLLRCN